MSDNIQKSIKRWLNTPTGTYPNVDKFFSRLARIVKGDFVIKDFEEDAKVSSEEVTVWVSRYRGSDTLGNGSFEFPFSTPQKAIDEAVIRGGHFIHKTINIEAKPHTRRDVYPPFICRTRNITIRGVGGIANIFSNWQAIGEDPGTVDSINCTVFTNLTEDGFTSFIGEGGFNHSYVGDTFAWTGGNFYGHELDHTLNTETDRTSLSFGAYYLGLTLENINFQKMTSSTVFGLKTPAVAFLFCAATVGEIVAVRDINMTNCNFSGFAGPSLLANNISDSKVINCGLSESGHGPVLMNCSSLLGDNISFEGRGGTDVVTIFATDTVNGIGGLKTYVGVLKNMVTPIGLNYQAVSATYAVFRGKILDTGTRGIQFNGPIRMDDYTSIHTKGSVTMNNSYGSLGLLKDVNIYGSYTQTAGNIGIMGGEINGNVTINGGSFRADGLTIRGNLVVANGVTIDFLNVTVLGTETLGSTSVVTRWKGGSFYGTLTDSGVHAFPAAGTLMNK